MAPIPFFTPEIELFFLSYSRLRSCYDILLYQKKEQSIVEVSRIISTYFLNPFDSFDKAKALKVAKSQKDFLFSFHFQKN